MQNHFELFHLPVQFELDMPRLDQAYREVQARVHPDKFVKASTSEQRVAMQWATRANEAYQTLKSPLKRAIYLCELHEIPLQTESNTAMPTAFLMQQMEWREQLEQAKHHPTDLIQLATNTRNAHQQQVQQIAEQFVQLNYHQAGQLIRQLMFLEKFRDEIAKVQENLS